MGLSYRKRVRVGKSAALNFSKSGVSLSLGRPGATMNVGGGGVHSTVGIPGSGLSYRSSGKGGGGSFLVLLLVLAGQVLFILSRLAMAAFYFLSAVLGAVVKAAATVWLPALWRASRRAYEWLEPRATAAGSEALAAWRSWRSRARTP
jgi:hypothetical protein